MQWYDGSIEDAVEKAKETSACLIVFVEGEDDLSQRLEQFFAEEQVSQLLQQSNFVAIRFTQQSNTYMHFASIYKVVPVPSVFFIGQGGTPLEIGTGLMQTSDDLITKIKKVLKLIESKASTSVTGEGGVCTVPSKSAAVQQKKNENEEPQKPQTSSSLASAADDNTQEIEVDEYKLRAEHLRQVQQKIRRDKLDDQAARERVLAQIAADRQERAQSALTEHLKERPKPQLREEASNILTQQSNIVRLQFRLANGTSRSHTFDAKDPFSQVREFVRRELLSNSSAKMILAIAYPKRELTVDCDSQTLAELGLCPSAVILVILLEKVQHSKAVRERFDSIWTVISKVIWVLLSPLVGFANYLGSFFGGRATVNDADAQAKKDDDQRNDIGRIKAYRRAYGTGSPGKNSDSNINSGGVDKHRWAGGSNVHRLSDQRRDDDEDENATWNGNSTQQQ